MEKVLMKCGHTANATYTDENGEVKPCCAICLGTNKGATEIVEKKANLKGRIATCICCHKEKASDYGLPFFEHNKKYKTDSYYCGCKGWD